MSRTVSGALGAGVGADALACAAHEIGHGIACQAARFPVNFMRLRPKPRSDPGWRGETNAVVPGPPFTTTADLHGFQVVLMAGEAAVYRFCRRHLDMPARAARGAAEKSASHDLDAFTALAGPRLSLAEARSRAAALVDRHGTRIDRFTVRLADTGRLPGSVL